MFKHVITRDVAYELMVRARRALHQVIAEWYEQHHAAQLPGFYPLLAYHWSRTDETAKAVRFQGLGRAGAGERCLPGGGAVPDRALERDPPPSKDGGEAAQFRRAGWERQLAEAHLGFGNTGEGRLHLGRALELLGTPLPETNRQLGVSVLRQLTLQAIHRAFPNQAVGQGRRPPEESLEASRAYMRLTEVFWFANDVPALVHASLQALNQAEQAGPSPELARAYSIMCLAAGSVPIHPLAQAYARRAEQTARPHRPAMAPGLCALYHLRVPDRRRPLGGIGRCPGRGQGLLEQAGDRRALGDALTVQAMSWLYRGEFRRAAGFDDVQQRGRRDEPQHQVQGLLGKARVRAASAQLDQAVRLLEAALTLLTDHPDQAEQLRAYGLMAVVRLRQGPRTPRRPPGRPPASSPGSGRRRPTTCLRLRRRRRVYLSLWESDKDPATRAERPDVPAETCEASPASSRSASHGPGSGKGAWPTCPDSPSGHRRPGGQVWPPLSGSACPSRPPSHMPNWAGRRPTPRSDTGAQQAQTLLRRLELPSSQLPPNNPSR